MLLFVLSGMKLNLLIYCIVPELGDSFDLGRLVPVLALPNRGPGQCDSSRDFDSFSDTDRSSSIFQ